MSCGAVLSVAKRCFVQGIQSAPQVPDVEQQQRVEQLSLCGVRDWSFEVEQTHVCGARCSAAKHRSTRRTSGVFVKREASG